MFFKMIETKGLAHYSYVVGEGTELAVIDPMRDIGVYLREAREAGMQIKYILETHRNEDYVIGSIELQEKTGAKVCISGHEELGHVYGEKIMDGHEIIIGNIKIKAIHTPGHTLGHLSYAVYEDSKPNPYMVFTGDCLFMGDLGRTDFYGENNLHKMSSMMYDSVFEKLMPLGDEVLMFPAHVAGSACGDTMDKRPFSTLGYEKRNNQALQVCSKEEFVETFARMRIKPRYFERIEVLNVKGGTFVGESVNCNVLTIAEVKAMKDDVILLDVRKKEAYFGGHIPGSIYMSKDSLTTFLGSIFFPDDKIAFVIDDHVGDVEELYWYCKRIGFDNIIGYLPNGAKQWEENGEILEKFTTINAKEFIELPKIDEYILLDLRKKEEIEPKDPSEYRVNIALQNIHKCIQYLNDEKPIYVLCGSGERATIGSSYLKTKGYNSIVITGGVRMLAALE